MKDENPGAFGGVFGSIRGKLLLVILVLFVLVIGTLMYFSYNGQLQIIADNEQEIYNIIESTVQNSMENELDQAETSILSVVTNPEVSAAFAARDRERLSMLLGPVYAAIKEKGVAQFHFHTPPATSFLRLQSPEKYGDDLSGFRKTVVACNNEQRLVKGLEEGKDGFGFRVVVPVTHLGRHVGSAEYGFDFGQHFLQHLNESVPGTYFIYRLPDQGSVAWDNAGTDKLAGTVETDPFPTDSKALAAMVSNGKMQHYLTQDKLNSVVLVPFTDYEGSLKGYIKVLMSRAETVNKLNSIRNQALLIIVVSLIIVSALTIFMVRYMLLPINKVHDVALALADGDLGQQVDVKTHDEIGRMAAAVNQAIKNLRLLVGRVSDTSQQIAAASQQLSASADEVGNTTQQVTETINQLAIGADDQARAASDSGSAVEKMSISIQSVATLSQDMTTDADGAVQIAKIGEELVQQAASQMQAVQASAQQTTTAINSLGSMSQEIGQIVEVITVIAEQTNLLALNAAIEAARAGEQGRGFAVVAEEVRKLAEQSRQAADQIASLIQATQQETGKAVQTTESSSKEVAAGTDLVNRAGEIFQEIHQAVATVVNRIQEVNKAAQELSYGSDAVVRAVESVAATAEETAAGTEEISASSEEQNAAVAEIASSSQSLAEMAQELQDAVRLFKL